MTLEEASDELIKARAKTTNRDRSLLGIVLCLLVMCLLAGALNYSSLRAAHERLARIKEGLGKMSDTIDLLWSTTERERAGQEEERRLQVAVEEMHMQIDKAREEYRADMATARREQRMQQRAAVDWWVTLVLKGAFWLFFACIVIVVISTDPIEILLYRDKFITGVFIVSFVSALLCFLVYPLWAFWGVVSVSVVCIAYFCAS
ncbi:unnamed protein product [Vitrella brassicaformis CCMP3155]|uniref:Uncharacterized protein n=1 Tax=Vitrella brassicaformis (strain CCMP3155) TaxID=1169540 RepID=A0A0G4GVK9_VITBC|nr:unnamed protein product [Vitrella brassicaformis CCMP3155]|eukprot:CEM34775.1 unnamed protein product [Vitrella brassicaformis CCMP3155]